VCSSGMSTSSHAVGGNLEIAPCAVVAVCSSGMFTSSHAMGENLEIAPLVTAGCLQVRMLWGEAWRSHRCAVVAVCSSGMSTSSHAMGGNLEIAPLRGCGRVQQRGLYKFACYGGKIGDRTAYDGDVDGMGSGRKKMGWFLCFFVCAGGTQSRVFFKYSSTSNTRMIAC
jgi:hypothetical protein